jgi:hypothetical protein
MTYSITNVIKDELTGNANHVTPEIRNERLSICYTCEYFKKISRQCGQCGCFLDAKTRYKESTCPLNEPKW